MKNYKNLVINEYLNITSSLLYYTDCPSLNELKLSVLRFICDVYKSSSIFDECVNELKEASDYKLSTDTVLSNILNNKSSFALDAKCILLSDLNITRLVEFDYELLMKKLIAKANVGCINECKLLSIIFYNENKIASATNIFKLLSVNGDDFALNALIKKCLDKNSLELNKWENIYHIVSKITNDFSFIAISEAFQECSSDDLNIANIIMCMKQFNAKNELKNLDLPLSYYLLNSNDDYESKIENIKNDTNVYLELYYSNLYTNKKFGF